MSDDERKLIRKMLGSAYPNLSALNDAELEAAVTASLQSRDVIVHQAKQPPAATAEEAARRQFPNVPKPNDHYVAPIMLADGTMALPTQTRHTAGTQWLPMEDDSVQHPVP